SRARNEAAAAHDDSDRYLCTGPLYHAAPLAFSLGLPFLWGLPVVLMDGWDPEETLRLVEEHKITHMHLVPIMFHRMVSLPDEAETRFEYYKDDEKTSKAYSGDYFTLGDMGYVDDDGYLFLTDRSADLIISGGVNIYPAEVDAVMLTHPAVRDSCTIGIPNEE